MATSGSTNWTLTRDELITEALEQIGAVDAGTTPATTDINSAATTLNMLIKGLQSDNIYLRFIDEQTITLSDGTAAGDLDTGTARLLSGWIRISSQDYPLQIIDRATYDSIVAKAGEGLPEYVYVDYAPTLPKAYFYPTPDGTYTFHYRRERLVEDFDATANNPDFPAKAFEMLVNGLAHRLSGKYGLPMSERQYLESQFERAKIAYRAGDTQRNSRAIVAPEWVV